MILSKNARKSCRTLRHDGSPTLPGALSRRALGKAALLSMWACAALVPLRTLSANPLNTDANDRRQGQPFDDGTWFDDGTGWVD